MGCGAAVEQGGIRHAGRDRPARELHERRAGVAPEGVGLRGPVQIAERAREAVKLVLRRVVVSAGD
jgi:hypothetical protein